MTMHFNSLISTGATYTGYLIFEYRHLSYDNNKHFFKAFNSTRTSSIGERADLTLLSHTSGTLFGIVPENTCGLKHKSVLGYMSH